LENSLGELLGKYMNWKIYRKNIGIGMEIYLKNRLGK